MKHHFFNIFITSHFETDNLHFECLFDAQHYRDDRPYDVLTHVASEKQNKHINHVSYFRSDGNELDDIGLLLSVVQGTHIYCEGHHWGRASNRRHRNFELLLSDEIGEFLNISLKNLGSMNESLKNVLRTAMLMFYQAEHLLFYDDLRDILMMNCFEFLIGSLYRLDNNHDRDHLEIKTSYNHLLKKFGYQKFVDEELKKQIKPKKLSVFKKERNVRSFGDLLSDFERMRNWIAHGKQHTKPKIEDSPSDSVFTFGYRLESFIRIILIDLIFGKTYRRKFDVLYQLILEQNVAITVTPDMPKLRFSSVR